MNLPLPGFSSSKDSSADAGDLILSDVIGKDRSINVFAGFTRDIDTISKVVEDKSQNATVLAPLNSELQKLPRKPWEDPEDYEILGQSAYEGSAGEDRAHRNLRRFVEAHVVLASPWREGEKRKLGLKGPRTPFGPPAQMNPPNGNSWQPSQAQASSSTNSEHHVPLQQRALGSLP
ncbi:MAG: hypothetical protein LQ344_004391 [Seirophora lacunosa]|nr:MAG: hypothetical protein LQ344_004391 [Seirophora lacunosa]